MNTHVFSGPKIREVTEIGLLPFILAFANEEFRAYILIPVFPLRVFRHKSIFIRNPTEGMVQDVVAVDRARGRGDPKTDG